MGRDEGPLMGRDADLAVLLDAFNDGQICCQCCGRTWPGKEQAHP